MGHLCGQHVGGSLKESLGLAFCLHFTWVFTENKVYRCPTKLNITKAKVLWALLYLCVWGCPLCWAWCSWSGSDSSCWANFWWEWYQLLALKYYILLCLTSAGWLNRTHLKRRVGLGTGLGVRPLLLTRIWRDGEKHCCSCERESTQVSQSIKP